MTVAEFERRFGRGWDVEFPLIVYPRTGNADSSLYFVFVAPSAPEETASRSVYTLALVTTGDDPPVVVWPEKHKGEIVSPPPWWKTEDE